VSRFSLLDDLSLEDQRPRCRGHQRRDAHAEIWRPTSPAPQSSPVISLVNRILIPGPRHGLQRHPCRATGKGWVARFRFRQDGVLTPGNNLPKRLIPAITSRLKSWRGWISPSARMPQDGRIRRMVPRAAASELRCRTLAGRWGGKVVLAAARQKQHPAQPRCLDYRTRCPGPACGPWLPNVGKILVTGPTDRASPPPFYALLFSERNENRGINILDGGRSDRIRCSRESPRPGAIGRQG